MLTESQAERLAEPDYAPTTIISTPEYYGQIITTRTYGDRLRTLENVRKAGVTYAVAALLEWESRTKIVLDCFINSHP
jgi:biotin synthase